MLLLAQQTKVPWWASVLFFVTILVIVFLMKNRDRRYFQQLLDHDLAARGIGVLAIAFGLAFCYLTLYLPLANGMAGERIVWMHLGGVAIAAVFVLHGLMLLLAGKHGQKFIITRLTAQPTALQWSATIAVAAISVGLAFAYGAIIQSLGYEPLR